MKPARTRCPPSFFAMSLSTWISLKKTSNHPCNLRLQGPSDSITSAKYSNKSVSRVPFQQDKNTQHYNALPLQSNHQASIYGKWPLAGCPTSKQARSSAMCLSEWRNQPSRLQTTPSRCRCRESRQTETPGWVYRVADWTALPPCNPRQPPWHQETRLPSPCPTTQCHSTSWQSSLDPWDQHDRCLAKFVLVNNAKYVGFSVCVCVCEMHMWETLLVAAVCPFLSCGLLRCWAE